MADKKKTATQDRSTLGAAELQKELLTALDKRAKLEFSHKVAPLKNPIELRLVRREIARLKTHLRMTEGNGVPPKNKGKQIHDRHEGGREVTKTADVSAPAAEERGAAQDFGGRRRVRQDGQDAHRPRDPHGPPPLLREGHDARAASSTSTTRRTQSHEGDVVEIVEHAPAVEDQALAHLVRVVKAAPARAPEAKSK